jgi:hypothetical protein
MDQVSSCSDHRFQPNFTSVEIGGEGEDGDKRLNSGGRNLLAGAAVATATAVSFSGAQVARIDVWKIFAAFVGVWLFRAGRVADD